LWPCPPLRLSSDVSEIKLVFSIPPHQATPTSRPVGTWHRPSPRGALPCEGRRAQLGRDALGARAVLAKDINVGFANINTKAEGIENSPAFKEAFQRPRCLVPVDNFNEWKKTATGKQPYAIALADRGLMALAGLWENWRSSAGAGSGSGAEWPLCAGFGHCLVRIGHA